MREHIHNWLTEKTKIAGVIACGIRSPDRKTFTRTLSPQFSPVALENACRCVTDTFHVLQSNRFPSDLTRWVFENYFIYGFIRQDGLCLSLLTKRNTEEIKQNDLESIVAEFQSLPA